VKITNRLRETAGISILGRHRKSWKGVRFDEIIEHDPGEDAKIQVSVRGDGYTSDPFPRNAEVLLVSMKPPLMCDWTAAQADLDAQALKVTGSDDDDAVAADADVAAKVAAIIIGAAVTGLAALGARGAFPAAFLFGVGNLLLASFTKQADQPPPDPPTIDQITSAVRSVVRAVVREELEKQAAMEAATSFLLVASRLQEMAKYSWDQIEGPGAGARVELSRHDREDFRRRIENIEGDLDNTRLYWHLEHFRNNPQIAMFALPAYAAGVGASLTVKRFHTLFKLLEPEDPPRLTPGDLDRLIAFTKLQLTGLQNALNAFHQYRLSILKGYGLAYDTAESGLQILGASEAQEARTRVDRIYAGKTGVSTTEKGAADIDRAINVLTAERSLLANDLPTTKFWTEEYRYPIDDGHGGWEKLDFKAHWVNDAAILLEDRKTIIPFVDGRLGESVTAPTEFGESYALGSVDGRFCASNPPSPGWINWYLHAPDQSDSGWRVYPFQGRCAGMNASLPPLPPVPHLPMDNATISLLENTGATFAVKSVVHLPTGLPDQATAQVGGSPAVPILVDKGSRVYGVGPEDEEHKRHWVRLPFWARHAGPEGWFIGTVESGPGSGNYSILRRDADGTIKRVPGWGRMIGGTSKNPVIINAANEVFRMRDAEHRREPITDRHGR